MSLTRAVRDLDVDSVRHLLASPSGKRSINVLDEYGAAPVHYAAQTGNLDILIALYEAEANLNLEEGGLRRATPLHLAAASGSLPLIDFLLDHGANINKNSLYPNPFNLANLVEISPLLVAASVGQFGAALHLLNRGADPRSEDQFDKTLLHYCVLGDLPNDPNSASDDLLAVMRAAVDAGVDPNANSRLQLNLENYFWYSDWFCAIHLAAIFNKPLLVSFLAGAGAEVDVGDTGGKTPLHFGTMFESFQAFQALLDAGAKIDAVDGDGRSVLHMITRPHYSSSEGRHRIFELAIVAGIDINTRSRDSKYSPLVLHAMRGNVADVSFFIDNGADLHTPTASNFTAAHIAAYHMRTEVLQILIDAGADLKARGARGTVLEVVAKAYAGNRPHLSPAQKEERLEGYESIMSILVAAGEREWTLIPTPCRGLHRALPAVMREAPDELGELFKRLVPEIQGRIRTALLLLNCFSPDNVSTIDLRLPLLDAVLEQEDM